MWGVFHAMSAMKLKIKRWSSKLVADTQQGFRGSEPKRLIWTPKSWVVLEGIHPLGDEGCSYLISNKANEAICKPLYQATWDVYFCTTFSTSLNLLIPRLVHVSSFFFTSKLPKGLIPASFASRFSSLEQRRPLCRFDARWVKLITGIIQQKPYRSIQIPRIQIPKRKDVWVFFPPMPIGTKKLWPQRIDLFIRLISQEIPCLFYPPGN